jgi:serine/threonine protein phosphatase PrpC
MHIDTVLQRGYFHAKHCEDALVTESLANDRRLLAVMDGCSMGKEAVFASLLIVKLLRKIAKEERYKDFVQPSTTTLKEQLKTVLKELFLGLNDMKRMLDLDKYELLSTLVIGVVCEKQQEAEVLVVGDGVVCVNTDVYDFEQDNAPDYLGYHLDESFDTWYAAQQQRVSCNQLEQLLLATDGVHAFKNLREPADQENSDTVIAALCATDRMEGSFVKLARLVNNLEKANAWKATDDLAVIRCDF